MGSRCSPTANLSIKREIARFVTALALAGLSVSPIEGAPPPKKVPARIIAKSLYPATTPSGATLSAEQLKPLILYQTWPSTFISTRGNWRLKMGFYILTVRANGTVSNVEILQSTGHGLMEAETVRYLAVPELRRGSGPFPVSEGNETHCPVCGAVAVQEKCNWVAARVSPAVCHSDTCRGRVAMNCSEF